MKMIKLTSISGDEFAFNSDLIVKVWHRENESALHGSTVLTKDGDEMLVSDTLDEIIAKCNKK